MKTSSKIALGALAGAGALYGARALLRGRRRIDMAGRVAVITGSTTGLGFLLAKDAAGQGAIVVLNGRDERDLAAAEEEVRRRGAADVLGVQADVSVEGEADRLIRRALDRFGAVDVLINNAGTILVGPQATMTVEDYRRVVATNFWGAVYASQAVLPHMRRRQFGRIANISSIGGLAAMPHLTAYVASKFALTGYTKALRADCARDNILVTGVYPKTIRTGGHTHAYFKGDVNKEYLWFSATDTLPLMSASAESEAAKVWRGIRDGDPDVISSVVTRAAVAFDALMPGWSAEFKTLIERGMPAAVNLDAPAVRGAEIEGEMAEMFSRMVPSSARPAG
jgi:NAD(P)-dependent dehydrogenase (short-subunit alcohol dehydrogenase family)